ncbi:MAG: anthranilate synthase component I [Pseudomonadota bacterium]
MKIQPEQNAFSAAYARGENQVVWTELVADMDTAVSMMLKLTGAETYSFMLESVTGGEIRGRYSMIGARPDLIWRCRGEKAEINRAALHDRSHFKAETAPSLDSLRALIDECAMEIADGLPPMAAGLFGYLGYDCIRLVEHLPNVNPDPLGLPDAVMMRPSIIAIVDNIKDVVILCAPAWHDPNQSADECYLAACNRLQDGLTALDRAPALTPVTPAPDGPLREITPISNTTHAEYLEMVEKAKEYVRAGDVFQVVPSQRWSMDLDVAPFALYRALRRLNPSPYMFYFDFDGFQVVGASPEILVRLKGDTVTIRPIAGTRPRGATPAEDDALEADLLADQKELAEHLMLLDLGRNDVGRVAKIGTVDPNEQFGVERYSHVMHIVSNVDGKLREDQDSVSAFLAGMPAGTVSGAPKIRAMEIIDELEKEKRGVYAGGVGYFSSGGDMDTCIALRTGVVKGGKLYVQAGGGVVYDSDPQDEFDETVNKSKALVMAAGIARSYN